MTFENIYIILLVIGFLVAILFNKIKYFKIGFIIYSLVVNGIFYYIISQQMMNYQNEMTVTK